MAKDLTLNKKQYIKEDSIPTNCVGDASKMAGLDNNPPVKKKKKLRDIVRR
jgi:hypothetical protein